MARAPDLGIAALERDTGIPAGTLRNWERRYGFPVPARTDGGHRLYDPAVLGRLRLVAAALERGHRPARVVPADEGALRALLETEVSVRPSGGWITLCKEGDATRLGQELLASQARLGAERWVLDVVAPFVEEVGEAWAAGALSVAGEHLATDVIRGVLVSTWRPLVAVAAGRRAVLATLPGERHELGLHMVAVLAALRGWRVTFLGADSPVEEILRYPADAVLVSVAAGSTCEPHLSELRRRLGETPLLVGGAGAPGGLVGLEKVLELLPG